MDLDGDAEARNAVLVDSGHAPGTVDSICPRPGRKVVTFVLSKVTGVGEGSRAVEGESFIRLLDSTYSRAFTILAIFWSSRDQVLALVLKSVARSISFAVDHSSCFPHPLKMSIFHCIRGRRRFAVVRFFASSCYGRQRVRSAQFNSLSST